MKKSMLIAFVSLLGLTACGGNTPTSAEEESSTKGTSSTSETIDYGELNIPLQTIREGYEKKISPVFSIPERAEELSYTVVDETVCVINDGVISGLKEGSTKVMAKSEHFEKTFYVSVEGDSQFSAKVSSRFNDYSSKLDTYAEEGRTIFAGDSFFDTEFWSNFYSTYYGEYNAYTMGISSTTADDWFWYAQKLILPFEPENIVFHIGTNDINDDKLGPVSTSNKIKTLMEEIHGELPNTRIYLFGIEPSITFSSNFQKEVDTNETMKKYSEENSSWLTYLDSPSHFTNEKVTGANGSMLRDGLHPKLENYYIYVDLLKESGLVIPKLNK